MSVEAPIAGVVRKVAWRLVPFLVLLYFVAFIDRVNVGFAALQMNGDVGLSASAFGFGSGLFFLSYFLFEAPSTLALQRFGAKRWLSRIMISWGLVSAGMALVRGPTSFYCLRFLLGAAEAGFFPAIILYLSDWIPKGQAATVTGLFMAGAPAATAVGSVVSGALLRLPEVGGLRAWQQLYLLEALPAVLLGLACRFYLTDRPSEAKWLSPVERGVLLRTLYHERSAATKARPGLWRAMIDPRVLALSMIYFGGSAGLYTIGIWAPQMFQRFTSDALAIGLANGAVGIIAVVGMVLWSWHSDRTQERIWHVALPCLLAAAGLALTAAAATLPACLVTLSLVNLGVGAAKPPLWALPRTFLKDQGAAMGVAVINSVGNLGGFAGPFILGWTKQLSGSFAWGLYAVAILLVFSSLITALVGARIGVEHESA